jgi:thiamine biosynthesis protein ThiI
MSAIQDAVQLPVLRPLLTYDKEEIMELTRKIGTFETSNLAHEDCCTLFIPKHPETKAKIPLVQKSETALDTKSLIQEAIQKTETITISA